MADVSLPGHTPRQVGTQVICECGWKSRSNYRAIAFAYRAHGHHLDDVLTKQEQAGNTPGSDSERKDGS